MPSLALRLLAQRNFNVKGGSRTPPVGRQGREPHWSIAPSSQSVMELESGEMATPRTPGGTAIRNKPIMIYLHPNTAVYDPSAGLGLLVNLVVLEGLQDVRCATVAFSGAQCNCC